MNRIGLNVTASLVSAIRQEWDGHTPCFFHLGLEEKVILHPISTTTTDLAQQCDGFVDLDELSLFAGQGLEKYRKELSTNDLLWQDRQSEAAEKVKAYEKRQAHRARAKKRRAACAGTKPSATESFDDMLIDLDTALGLRVA